MDELRPAVRRLGKRPGFTLVPLARLQVGDTVIRARVTVDGEVAGTVVRVLRKVR